MSTIKVTPAVRREIIEWYRRKCELGTYRSMARKHGICIQYVEKIVLSYKKNSRGNNAIKAPSENDVVGLERHPS